MVDDVGQPIANTRLLFEDAENFQNITVTTDSLGKFKADFVAGVNYIVSYDRGEKKLEGIFRILFPRVPGQGINEDLKLSPKIFVKPEAPVDAVE